MMTPELIFKLQCQVSHLNKSIAAVAHQLNIDPNEMTIQTFRELLDTINGASGEPEAFTKYLGISTATMPND